MKTVSHPAPARNRRPLSYFATDREICDHFAAGLPDAAAYVGVAIERDGEEVVLPCCEAMDAELDAVAASGTDTDRARVAAYRDLLAAEEAAACEEDRLVAIADRDERRAA